MRRNSTRTLEVRPTFGHAVRGQDDPHPAARRARALARWRATCGAQRTTCGARRATRDVRRATRGVSLMLPARADCERNPKLRATVICPDPWRDGAAAGQVTVRQAQRARAAAGCRRGWAAVGNPGVTRLRRASPCGCAVCVQSSGGRSKNENKLLTNKARYGGAGLGTSQKCLVCKKQLAAGGKWCQECAHVRGICYICGKQILDTAMYSHHSNALMDNQKSKAEIAAARPEVASLCRCASEGRACTGHGDAVKRAAGG